MIYIALLRGVNVGGKATVSMATLKTCFEALGFTNVKTYINSGNIIFSTEAQSAETLSRNIEKALDQNFDPGIRVLIKTQAELQEIVASVPPEWTNDANTKCDVMFLWPTVDKPETAAQLPSNATIEEVRYLPGAILWHIDRQLVTKSRIPRIIGSAVYKQITIRNINTARKLVSLADALN